MRKVGRKVGRKVVRKVVRIVRWFFTTVGAIVVASIVSAAIWVTVLDGSKPDLPDRMVLSLRLNTGVVETRSGGPFALFDRGGPHTMREVLGALQKAAADDRVAGIAVELGRTRVNVAQAQELRDAIIKFRNAGKFAVAFADAFGAIGNGTIEYFLATSFDEIWMQPSGELAITGLSVELPFAAEALDSIGVTAKFGQRHQFKSAPETFTRRSMSEPARRNLQRLLNGWFDQVVDGVAEGRGLTRDAAVAAVDASPLLAAEAQDSKLIDTLGYWPAFEEAVEARSGDAEDVSLRRYIAEGDMPHSEGPKVALIYGLGPIVAVESGDPFDEGGYFAAYTAERAILDAIDDNDVKAILLRVDSPGGSYVASDTVFNALMRARARGKPVVVSMAGTAASGGYFVAMAADSVVAQAGTVTGSIGVYAGKFVTNELWSELGIAWQSVSVGKHAEMWSPFRDYSPSAEARLDAMLDFVYRDFTAKVADRRNLDAAQVDAAARGRIWTGEDAVETGLVDKLGGLNVAIGAVKETLGLKPEDEIALHEFPKPRSPFERLIAAVADEEESIGAVLVGLLGLRSVFADVLEDRLGPIAKDLDALRPPVGRLQMPPFRLRR